jgi:hypothetical protein
MWRDDFSRHGAPPRAGGSFRTNDDTSSYHDPDGKGLSGDADLLELSYRFAGELMDGRCWEEGSLGNGRL